MVTSGLIYTATTLVIAALLLGVTDGDHEECSMGRNGYKERMGVHHNLELENMCTSLFLVYSIVSTVNMSWDAVRPLSSSLVKSAFKDRR